MAGELPDLTIIGRKALEIPQNIVSIKMRQMNEDMTTMTNDLQGIMASIPPLPVLGQNLPGLPGLPGMKQTGEEQPKPTTIPQRSQSSQSTTRVNRKAYMEA